MGAGQERLRTVAVVLAGGLGTRIGHDTPKQLLPVAGKPIIEHTLEVFEATEAVDEILVLMAAAYLDEVSAIVARRGFAKVTAVLAGGVTRNDSTQVALDHLGHDECKVLFHDGVRPLVTTRIVSDCVAALDDYAAVAVVIRSTDTIVVVDDRVITAMPDRRTLRRCQTPQAFRLSTIRRAYELAWQDPGFAATDDCSVVFAYLPDVPIGLVEGAEDNLKVTTPLDLEIAERLLDPAAGGDGVNRSR